MTVFGVAAENSNDEITKFQIGRYVSKDDVMWRIFLFALHERLFTWQYIWKKVKECILQRKTYLNVFIYFYCLPMFAGRYLSNIWELLMVNCAAHTENIITDSFMDLNTPYGPRYIASDAS